MKKYDYLVRDLDLLCNDTNELENKLQEYGNHGFKLITAERYIYKENAYFRCIFIKEYIKDMDKDEIGYEDLFQDDN